MKMTLPGSLKVRSLLALLVLAATIPAGVLPAWGQTKRSGIFYSTLYAKTGQYIRIREFGTNGAACFLADTTGSHRADAVIYYGIGPSLGQWLVARGNGQVFSNPSVAVVFTNATTAMKPLMADVNGDGRQDACLFDPATGSWWVALSTGTNFGRPVLYSTGSGYGSTDQFLADVDGDGKADAIVYFGAGGLAGQWHVGRSQDAGFASFAPWLTGFGANTTRRLVGDVNGDGKADAVAFTQSSGAWQVALSSGSGFANNGIWLTNFATDAGQVFLYDVDRDGRADAVAVQASTADWWVVYSTGAKFDGSYLDRWIANLHTAFPKEGFPAPQAFLTGSLDGSVACACAVTLGDWFALTNGNKYATVIADTSDTWSAWGDNYIPQLPGLVGAYDSGDPTVNDAQLRLLHDAGFDYLMFDDTNGRAGWVESRIANWIQRLRAWNRSRAAGQHPVYFCLSEGSSRGQTNYQQLIEQESAFAWNTYYQGNRDAYYTSAGKPLLIHFVWDPSYSSNFTAWAGDKTYSSRFTIRWMYNAVANDPAYADCYGWQVAVGAGNPVGSEVMDVMPGFWNGATFTSRSSGSFYANQWKRVLQYQPASVWVNSWNESWEHTSVEPAWLSGRWVAYPGLTQWNDYYGTRMDSFYHVMTSQYNWLFRNNALVTGAYLRESGDSAVYQVAGSNYVLQSALPRQAPVLAVPTGFRANFKGLVVPGDFTGWSGPRALYQFDEASGAVLVDAVGGSNGQMRDGMTRVEGVEGMAVVADGATGYARFPQNLAGDFSLVLWLKTDEVRTPLADWSQGRLILADEDLGQAGGAGLTLVAGGRLAFGLNTPTLSAVAESSVAINDGQWRQIAATRDSITGELRLYVDGLFQSSTFGAAGEAPASGYVRLGGGSGASSFLGAAFDTLQVYDQVLSPPTVAVLVTNPPSGRLMGAPALAGANLVARYAGLPGQTYSVQFTDDLIAANWQTLTNLIAPSTDEGLGIGVFQFILPIGAATSGFYRLEVRIR